MRRVLPTLLAQLPLVPALAAELHRQRPARFAVGHRVFPDGLPRMTRVHADFARAGIETVDKEGRRADFHSLRYTFCTRLRYEASRSPRP